MYLCCNCSSVGCLKCVCNFTIIIGFGSIKSYIPTAEHFRRSHPQCEHMLDIWHFIYTVYVKTALMRTQVVFCQLQQSHMHHASKRWPSSKSLEVVATADATLAFTDIDAVILVGAMPRKEGMERKDLLKANAKIFAVQGKALDAVAKKNVKVQYVRLFYKQCHVLKHGKGG